MLAGELDLTGAIDFSGALAGAGAGALVAAAFGATLAVVGAVASLIAPVEDFEATGAADLAPVVPGLVVLPGVVFLVFPVAAGALATLGAVLAAVEVTEETELLALGGAAGISEEFFLVAAVVVAAAAEEFFLLVETGAVGAGLVLSADERAAAELWNKNKQLKKWESQNCYEIFYLLMELVSKFKKYVRARK